MSAVIKTIKDYFNNYVYPKTKTKAVYDDSNNRLDQTLASVAHFDNDSAAGTISDPVLKQSDIATTLGTSDTVPASQNLVNTLNSQLIDKELIFGTNTTTDFQLTKAYTNYRYLLCIFVANSQYTTMLIPTSEISSSRAWTLSMSLPSATGQLADAAMLKYLTYCSITFTTTTNVTHAVAYNNSNMVLHCRYIYGLQKIN